MNGDWKANGADVGDVTTWVGIANAELGVFLGDEYGIVGVATIGNRSGGSG